MSPQSKAKREMTHLVLNVLVGARERWAAMSILDKQKLVAHMRVIANEIEISIGNAKAP